MDNEERTLELERQELLAKFSKEDIKMFQELVFQSASFEGDSQNTYTVIVTEVLSDGK